VSWEKAKGREGVSFVLNSLVDSPAETHCSKNLYLILTEPRSVLV